MKHQKTTNICAQQSSNQPNPSFKLNAGQSLLLATHNDGKLEEFVTLFAPWNIDLVSAKQYSLIEPEETGNTFAENAILKAQTAASSTGLTVLADDSGLCVDALNGDPGIYSARWAGKKRDFNVAMRTVWQQLADKPCRNAYFICVLALCNPTGKAALFEGRVSGHITWPTRGRNGFGYDPFFIPQGYTKTFAELDLSIKDQIGHRAQAFNKLCEYCF